MISTYVTKYTDGIWSNGVSDGINILQSRTKWTVSPKWFFLLAQCKRLMSKILDMVMTFDLI